MKQYDVRLRDRVHEADLYVGANTQSLSVRLRQRVREMDVYITELLSHESISVKDVLILTAHPAMTELARFIGVDDSRVVLGSNIGRIVRTVFDKCPNRMQLESVLNSVHSDKSVYDLESDMVLQSAVRAIDEAYCACEDLLYLTEKNDVDATLTSYTVADWRIELSQGVAWSLAEKYAELSYCAQLASRVHAVIEILCSLSEDTMEMTSSANASLTLYRLLFQVDQTDAGVEQYLSDIDGFNLQELDYIDV